MANFARQNGIPGEKTVSVDQIDFVDGRGPIDPITASDTWWFRK